MEDWLDNNAAEKNYKLVLYYPKSVADHVMDRLRQSEKMAGKKIFDVMIDIGCGHGSSLLHFTPYFRSILGIDVSEQQIETAREINKNSNVSYFVANETSLPVKDKSVDLITSAGAAHYFDMDSFIVECKRVLKPGGLVAIYGHDYSDLLIQPYEDITNGSYNNKPKMISGHNIYLERLLNEKIKFLRRIGRPAWDYQLRYNDLFSKIKGMKKERSDDLSFDVNMNLEQFRRNSLAIPPFVKFHESFDEKSAPLNLMTEELKELANMQNKKAEDLNMCLSVSLFFIFMHN